MGKYTALIAGATGLVGRELVSLLLEKGYYEKVKILTRRKLEIEDERLEQIIVEDFSSLDQHASEISASDFYCTLGTTIKKAGSKGNFEKVDLHYPLKLAQLAKSSPEFEQFLIVTAAGSNASSPLFYNRVKGRVEEELENMEPPALKIFRPSLLLGDREEFRVGESIGKILSAILTFFMVGSKKGMFSIHAKDVARSMYLSAMERSRGVKVYKSSKMAKLAKNAGI